MTRQTASQAAKDIQFARWLYWQLLRRSPKYRRSVAGFLRGVKQQRKKLRELLNAPDKSRSELTDQQRLDSWGKRRDLKESFKAYDWTLRIYGVVRSYGQSEYQADPHGMDDMKGPTYGRLHSRVMRLVSLLNRHRTKFDRPRWRPTGIIVKTDAKKQYPIMHSLPGEPYTILPAIDEFEKKWGLRFPLPPSFPVMLEAAFTSKCPYVHPVRIIESKNAVTIRISLCWPKKLLLAFADGAIHHFMPHTRTWETVARKGKGRRRAGSAIKIVRYRRTLRVRVPFQGGPMRTELKKKILSSEPLKLSKSEKEELAQARQVVRLDKGQVIQHVRQSIPESSPWRLRKDKLREVFLVMDLRKRGLTQDVVAGIVFPANPDVSLVAEREGRFRELSKPLGL